MTVFHVAQFQGKQPAQNWIFSVKYPSGVNCSRAGEWHRNEIGAPSDSDYLQGEKFPLNLKYGSFR